MKDLKLNLDTNELDFENFDFKFIDGIDRVVQQIHVRLHFFHGEWFLNSQLGVKYYDVIFVKKPNIATIDSVLKATILDTEDVLELINYTSIFNSSTRQFTISFRVNPTFGQTDTQTEVLP